MLNALVIEDSRLARQGLMNMLTVHSTINVIADAANITDAIALIQQHQPELLFLDIHMPEGNGFDLLAQLDYQPKVIFTTAYAEYAIQSFDHNTVDYLLKPISKARLAEAVFKLTATNSVMPTHSTSNEPTLLMNSRIFVKDDQQCHLLQLSAIDLIESCKNYVQVFWCDENSQQQKAFIKKPLTQIEARLPERDFFRANRQFIINLHSVINIEENFADGYDLTLSNGRLIDVSRRNAAKLKELLSL